MEVLSSLSVRDHEQVVVSRDRETGLRAIVAIHDTRLGPGLGGIRIRNYASEDAALTDVLRLSQAMSYKSAAAGLNFGGAKAVILEPLPADRRAAFRAMGRILEGLAGRYVATEDMGMGEADIAVLNEVTQWAVGRSLEAGGSGDPSPHTAEGVFVGMRSAMRAAGLGDDFAGRRVAVHGCGNVGVRLVRRLVDAGAEVLAADIVADKTAEAERAGAQVVSVDQILEQDVDVVAPCAIGAVVNVESIPGLRCRVVAGAANNQLAESAEAARLAERGIVYAPDFMINAGGVINVGDELAPKATMPAGSPSAWRALKPHSTLYLPKRRPLAGRQPRLLSSARSVVWNRPLDVGAKLLRHCRS